MQLEDIAKQLMQQFPTTINCRIARGQLTIEVIPKELLLISKLLKNSPYYFEQLIDLAGVDYLDYVGKEQLRFAVVYHLLSITNNLRLRIRCYCEYTKDLAAAITDKVEQIPVVPSVINIWQSATYYECEAFDLFGIQFTGHPKLQRILTDYAVTDHPFRKDFPLIGKHEIHYDKTTQQVSYQPVTIKEPKKLKKMIAPNYIRADLQDK